jgi:hypothetical protein
LACPYFMPLKRLENGGWHHPARLPLGAGWRGQCTAPGHEGALPELTVIESSCNLGYASQCAWAPTGRKVDAVRFAVNAPPESKGKNISNQVPRILSLRYVCEREHRPVEHGDLQFDLSAASWIALHSDARIQEMAECFLESYLRKMPRKGEPPATVNDKRNSISEQRGPGQ